MFVSNYELPHQFPLLLSFSAPHSNTQHISHIQQKQTSHQAQQLYCLKSTGHEGLNKESVSISVPADREDKGQDQRWYFKQKVDSTNPCILLSGKWNLNYVQDSKASTSAICKTLLWAQKKLQHRGWMLWLLCWICRDCHEYLSTTPSGNEETWSKGKLFWRV